MDETITIGSMKKVIKEFCEARDQDQFHNPKGPAIGISIETDELLGISRFQLEEQMRELMSDQTVCNHIQEELADTPFFLLRFVQMNDVDLYDALTDKVSKNGQRYTIENSKRKNVKIHGQRLRDTLAHLPFL